MTIEELKKCKKIYLLGYGIEGQATHRFLKKFCPRVEVGIGDQKDDPLYLEKQRDYDLVIRSPGVSLQLVRTARGQSHTTATNIFFANAPFKTIGITGTKGKSTTATLVYELLQKDGFASCLAGNIGRAMLDLLTEEIEPGAAVVLELSSYQLEDVHYSPHISCVLNVYEELHNHSDFDSYRKAKYAIASHTTKKDFLIYNPKLPHLSELLKGTHAKKIPFAPAESSLSFSPMLNQDTVQALVTIAEVLRIQNSLVQKVLNAYHGLPHRLEKIGKYNGITFINDSAANHPQATLHALAAVENVATIFLGGQDREFNFTDVVRTLKEKNVRNIVLFPDTQQKILDLLSHTDNYNPIVCRTDSMEEAVRFVYEQTQPDSVCLMSPGAPSYSMYTGFPARAEAFINAIHTYAKKDPS